jgi:hypothetical protein
VVECYSERRPVSKFVQLLMPFRDRTRLVGDAASMRVRKTSMTVPTRILVGGIDSARGVVRGAVLESPVRSGSSRVTVTATDVPSAPIRPG